MKDGFLLVDSEEGPRAAAAVFDIELVVLEDDFRVEPRDKLVGNGDLVCLIATEFPPLVLK
jgi:hypothetical protein